MSLINISYASGFPFSGQASPFVGRLKEEIDYGERWAAQETIILNGMLTGCTFGALTTAQLALISGFSIDYQPLDITYGLNVTSGLVCWYKFNEGAGNTIFDSTYSQNTGTLIGSPLPTWTGGQVGTGALGFNGQNYVQSQLINFPTGSNPRTISFWAQMPVAQPGISASIISYGTSTAVGGLWNVFYTDALNEWELNIFGGTSTVNWNYDSGWHMITMVLPNGANNINQVLWYIDGIGQASSSLARTINTSVSSGGAFLAAPTGQSFGNSIVNLDDFRVFNRGLSPSEISGLYTFGANNGYDLNWPVVYVDDIDFPENKYLGVLPYRITLKTFPSGYFSGYYGVLDPINRVEYKEQSDGVIQITHSVGARGINTSTGLSNAFQNAQNYVFQYTGLQGIIQPIFITSGLSGVLIEQKENIDRFKGQYSIVETYLADKYNPCQYGVLRYKVDVQQPQAGFNQGKIDGTLRGSFNQNITGLRGRFSGFDPFSNLMFFTNSGINFNPNPLTKQITEDTYNQVITFNFTYDDNPFNLVNANYEIGINSGINITEVEVKGNINGRGDLESKWQLVQQFFVSGFNPYAVASTGYYSFAGTGFTGFTLDPVPIQKAITYDSFNGQIDFSYRYTNEQIPLSNYLEYVDYSTACSPPLRSIVSLPLVTSRPIGQPSYETTDLNFIKRGTFKINGKSYPKTQYLSSGVAQTRNLINSIFTQYTSGFYNVYLENYDLEIDTKDNITFDAAWTYDSGDVLNGQPNYTQIVNL